MHHGEIIDTSTIFLMMMMMMMCLILKRKLTHNLIIHDDVFVTNIFFVSYRASVISCRKSSRWVGSIVLSPERRIYYGRIDEN